MADIRWERYPFVAQVPHARSWLTIQANLGLAPTTIETYGRALEDYLRFCTHHEISVETATRESLARYVHDLASRPNRRGANVRGLNSGVGLANATLQQRLTVLRLLYDYLMEEGLRPDNPVGRGRYTPGKGFGGHRDRGLIPHYQKLPWIPSDEQWQAILDVVRTASLRNRFMLALSYDAALRREEVCALQTGDLDPARRLVHIRAETTKGRAVDRVVPYSEATNLLYVAYLDHRRTLGRKRGPQSWRADFDLDLVEGDRRRGEAFGSVSVFDAYATPSLPDRSGPLRLGYS